MIDCHIHLDDERFFAESEQLIADFDKDKIDFVINGSCDISTMKMGVELSKKYAKVFTTIGSHPHEVKFFGAEMKSEMERFSVCEKVVAVGEIGLDYFYDHSPRELQKQIFVEQLAMANDFKLPCVLHIRDAYHDALDILKNNKTLLKNGVVMHCYSGSCEIAKELLRLDCWFSFGGAITFKNAKKDEIILSLPREKILAETDAPYMTPEPNRGKTNYPNYIRFTYEKLAQVLGLGFSGTEEMIKKNAKEVFQRIKL